MILANRDYGKMFKNIVSVLLLIIILIVEGCFSFLDFSFDYTLIFNAAFWTVVFSKLIILICAKEIGMTIFEDYARTKNMGLQEAMQQYAILNPLRRNDFPNWVLKVLNPRIKADTYLALMKKKINKLERRTRSKYKILYSRELLPGENQAELDYKREHNRYCRKRKMLESLIEADYVTRNIGAISVRYTEVNPTNFDVSIYAKANVPNYEVLAHNNRMKLTGLIFASIILVVSNSLIEMLVFSFDKNGALSQAERFWNSLIKFVTNMAFVAWQFFQGIRGIVNIIEKSEHVAYANRNKILKEYLYKDQDKNTIDLILEKMAAQKTAEKKEAF